jgi:hypothetical protein
MLTSLWVRLKSAQNKLVSEGPADRPVHLPVTVLALKLTNKF